MNRNAGIGIIVAIIVVMAVIAGIMIRFPPPVDNRRLLPELDPLSSYGESPGSEVAPITIDNVTFQASVQFYMFMPHSGYNTFQFVLDINVTNDGISAIDNLNATKASVFYENSTHLYTFGLISNLNYTVNPGESRVFVYEEDRDMPVVLSMLAQEMLYLRVHVTYGIGSETIITTPLTQILLAIE